MKSKYQQKGDKKSGLVPVGGGRLVTRVATMLAMLAALLLFGNAARADVGNQLANPGFETGNASGWVVNADQGTVAGYTATAAATYYNSSGGVCPQDPTAENVSVFDGTYVGKIYGNFSATVNTCYFQQTIPTVAGSTWSASTYAYSSHEDLMAGQNSFVIDVAFLNSVNAVIGEYQSATVTNLTCGETTPFPVNTWVQMLVTNQIQNGVVIGTVPNGILTAPVGTASVRYQVLLQNVNYAGGSIYFDDSVLDLVSGPVVVPPVISNLTPNNTTICTNGQLTYTVTSSSGTIASAQVIAIMTGLPGSGAASNTVTYTVGSPGFTVTGLNTTQAVATLALTTNTAYIATVSATDNSGAIASAVDYFDTFKPVLLWEAEDFNYQSGQWITSVTADGGAFAYLDLTGSLIGVELTDEHDANPLNSSAPHNYRTSDGVGIGNANPVNPAGKAMNRQKYLNYYAANPTASTNANTVDQEVGYNNVGDWLNYTRNFPAGKYNVYASYCTVGSGPQAYFEQVLGDPTQPGQTVTNLGTFSMTDNNWNLYQYVPLLDQYGNLVSVTLGGTQTVRVQVSAGGNPNEDFYMLVPAVTIPKPVLQVSSPDGAHPFEPTNHFMFTVGQGAGSAIPAGNVGLMLNGSDVTAQVSFSSTPTNWTGTIAISSNAVYSAVISVTNSTHLSSTYTVGFDTFSQDNYVLEAEDFDFNSGSYIDNPKPTGDSTISSGYSTGTLELDSYYGYPEGALGNMGVAGVDYVNTGTGQQNDYRPFDTPGTQPCGDYQRQKFLDQQAALNDPNLSDFNIGWYSTGTWLNYTRHYPAGNYNVYGRLAGGAGAFSGTTLSRVTNGWGTATQMTNLLGSFADPTAAGWGVYHWVPMLDATGNLATVQFDGSTNTLKLFSGNNLNVNFLMFTPQVTALAPIGLTITHTGSQVGISFATQTGHTYTVLWTGSLSTSPIVWSTLTVIPGDGSTHNATDNINTSGAAARFYRVSAQ